MQVQQDDFNIMEIAKGVTAKEYLNLDLSKNQSPDWDKAFEYFRLRMTERFVEPADKLIDFEKEIYPSQKKYGFAVLAIDYLLSETIQSFYEGVTDSTGQSRRLFTTFLKERDSFKKFFIDDKQANDFYFNFRCGILHQAQTSADTKVHAVGSLISREGKFVIVNREIYHQKIKEELEIYIAKLKKRDEPSLMTKFKIKMDYISIV